MRNLLIAVVLLLTAGAFYSALWYKSEVIENDITARVTSALEETNAQNVGIDVDGRHVTLSGIVHDETTEASYLDTANETYGALGPIDGLTYQADGGYVSVVKSADGISLRGTVPNEDARAALIAQATAATSGTVDDQLMIAGPTADWQDEAAFGLTQMANLKEGTLMAAAGSFALSGMTDDDPATISSAFADRAGWETFVSAPTVVSDLSGAIAERDGRIEELEGEVGTLTTDLESVRTALTQEQSTSQSLNAELGETNTKVTAAAALAATLTSNVASRDTTITGLQGDLDSANSTIADLTSQVATRDGTIADLTSQVASRDDTITGLQGDLDGANGTIADLTSQVEARGVTIERLNGDLDKLDVQVAELQAMNQSTKGEDTARITALTQDVAARDATIQSLEGVIGETLDEGRAKTAALEGTVAKQGETIKLLEDALGETIDEGNMTASTLTAEVDTRDATIADLGSNLNLAQGELARLMGELAELSDAPAQVEALTATVAARDETIAALRAQPAPAAPAPTSNVAQQCATQAGNVMEGSRINFGSGTARIDADSVELLERLTGIALACVGSDLTVEVGGHTDAQGSDAANQTLSEARAQAVVAFMAERGVPTDGLKAVGYGEANPIADNTTPAGRAQNRRITFDWQAR